MSRIYIYNAILVNEGKQQRGGVVIANDNIEEILNEHEKPSSICEQTLDAEGCYLLPGVIDEHVHFRDPGLTKKADINTESQAAAAGGVTSIMDMPNTSPLTTTLEAWNDKMKSMSEHCHVNYSCYFGATNTNYNLFDQLDPTKVCGVKLFMGSSTGNMLVDRIESLRQVFKKSPILIATHCEDQHIIKKNTERYLAEENSMNGDLPLRYHPLVRSEEACYLSTKLAVELALEAGARLHVMHISTAKELELFDLPAQEGKRITAEACVAHLLFTSKDYDTLGTRIKCNPAIKDDRDALRQAVKDNKIYAIATDHAPHLLTDKQGGALKAASGMPMIQFSLVSMLQLVTEGVFTLEQVVEKMCHAPARLYQIAQRGFIKVGYKADLVLVRANCKHVVEAAEIKSKCGWSPLEGTTLNWKVEHTFVNGHHVYQNNLVDCSYHGEALSFNR